jgi:TonB family protein
MKVTKEEIYGLFGSSLFCGLILLLLYFSFLKTEVKTGEVGVLVQFGTIESSTGTFSPNPGTTQQKTEEPAPPEQTPPSVVEVVEQPVPKTEPVKPVIPKSEPPKQKPQSSTPAITQNVEQTAAIEEAKRKQKEQEKIEAERKAVALAAQAKAAEEQRKRDAINQQVSGAFGASAANTSPSGTGTGTGGGVQGSPQGANGSSGGGYGEFNLGGRTLGPGGLPRPAYSMQEEGKIVVSITVDPKGNVIFAEIGKGTNIDNANMRKSALEAARKAKFNNITENNNQSGTITYRYMLK